MDLLPNTMTTKDDRMAVARSSFMTVELEKIQFQNPTYIMLAYPPLSIKQPTLIAYSNHRKTTGQNTIKGKLFPHDKMDMIFDRV